MTIPHYAVIGHPVAHSRSPWIHARFGAQSGIALEYGLIDAHEADFADTVLRFFEQGGAGLNVTVPFKGQAFALAQHASPRARLAEAANTLWMQNGELHACNTDGVGLVRDLVQQLAPPPTPLPLAGEGCLEGSRILLVGAGGAARGVVFPLLDAGCAELRIVNRTPHTAQQLAEHVRANLPEAAGRVSAGGLADAAGARWDIVINASSSSLAGLAPDLPPGIYAPKALAYDMMYGATLSPFLRQAQAQGAARVQDGLGMLVQQAAESFFLWHGVRPDPAPVLKALRARLREEAPPSSCAKQP